MKLYTKSHDIDLLKEIDNMGGQFTAEEHTYVMQKEFANIFESREVLLRWYLSNNAAKLSALGFLIQYIIDKRFTNVLSLGAGMCVLEYLLKYALPADAMVVATDFDRYLINKAKVFFPGIIPVAFDFFKDDIQEIQNKIKPRRIDLAVFFGSSYVMNEESFIFLFKRLKEIGVKQIIDFYGGYLDLKTIINLFFLLPLKENTIIRKIFRKPLIEKKYLGKFHGYARSRSELKKLYKKAGFDLIKEISVGPYKYVAICSC